MHAQVTLKQPAVVEQLKLDDTDESLVSAALELAGVSTSNNNNTATNDTTTTTTITASGIAAPSPARSNSSTGITAATPISATAAGVLKVVQNELGKTVWIVRVLPHSEQRVPFEYTVEWPADKEIAVE
jgi:hypothetical protein